MKQTKLILIAILSGVFLLLGTVLVLEITGHSLFKENIGFFKSMEISRDGGRDPKNYTKVLEYETEADAGSIRELNLLFDKNSNEIFFYESDSDKILIQEYVNFDLTGQEKTTIKEQNGTLTVTGKKRKSNFFFFGSFNRHGYVKVYLPASFEGNLTASTISGDISTDMDFILGEKAELKVATTSGDVDLLKVQADNTDITTVSGELTIQEITGDTKLSTTSGDITVKKATGDMRFSTTSGEIEVSQGQGSCKAGTLSGDIELSALQGDFDISTTSGEVQIYLPEDTAVDFDASTTSGGINTFFDSSLSFNKKGNRASGVYGTGAPVKVEVDTTSGDVTVRAQ